MHKRIISIIIACFLLVSIASQQVYASELLDLKTIKSHYVTIGASNEIDFKFTDSKIIMDWAKEQLDYAVTNYAIVTFKIDVKFDIERHLNCMTRIYFSPAYGYLQKDGHNTYTFLMKKEHMPKEIQDEIVRLVTLKNIKIKYE